MLAIAAYANVLRFDWFRFFFYSSDRPEPVHVHVERAGNNAKVWMRPIRLASSHGFPRRELNQVLEIVQANEAMLMESWNEFFSDDE